MKKKTIGGYTHFYIGIYTYIVAGQHYFRNGNYICQDIVQEEKW